MFNETNKNGFFDLSVGTFYKGPVFEDISSSSIFFKSFHTRIYIQPIFALFLSNNKSF